MLTIRKLLFSLLQHRSRSAVRASNLDDSCW